jgi:hypothetical protein
MQQDAARRSLNAARRSLNAARSISRSSSYYIEIRCLILDLVIHCASLADSLTTFFSFALWVRNHKRSNSHHDASFQIPSLMDKTFTPIGTSTTYPTGYCRATESENPTAPSAIPKSQPGRSPRRVFSTTSFRPIRHKFARSELWRAQIPLSTISFAIAVHITSISSQEQILC